MLENLRSEVKLVAAGGAVFLVLMSGFRAYEEGQKSAQAEWKARLAMVVYQNPQKRRATANVRRSGAIRRDVTVTKSPDGTEKTEIHEHIGPTEEREETREETKPVAVPGVTTPDQVRNSFLAGGVLDIRAREIRPLVGYSWHNRVDFGFLPVRVNDRREMHFQPSVLVAVRF